MGIIGTITLQVLAITCFLALPAWLIYLAGNQLNRSYIQAVGYRTAIYLSGWLGTPIHELSHALVARLFRFKIQKIKLFAPNSTDGTLGSVSYIPQGRPLVREIGVFMVALAPYMGGSLTIYLLLRFFVPESRILFEDMRQVLSFSSLSLFDIFAGLISAFIGSLVLTLAKLDPTNWKHFLFLYLSFTVTAHMAPSRTDFRHCRRGFMIIAMGLLLAVIANTMLFMNRLDTVLFLMKKLLSVPVTMLMISLTMETLLLLASWLAFWIIKRFRKQ